MAYLQCAQDYDEWFPGFLTGPTSGVRVYWYDNIQPYLKNRNVYTCPSTRYYVAPNRYSTSQNTATDYFGFPTTQIKIPADKILIADAAGKSSGGSLGSRACMVYGAFDPAAANGTWNSCRGHLWPAHNEMTNVAFCDGHVKAMKPNADFFGDTTAGRNKHWLGANE